MILVSHTELWGEASWLCISLPEICTDLVFNCHDKIFPKKNYYSHWIKFQEVYKVRDRTPKPSVKSPAYLG